MPLAPCPECPACLTCLGFHFAKTLINSIIFAGPRQSAAQANPNRSEHIINNATARFVPRCVYVMCNVKRVVCVCAPLACVCTACNCMCNAR